MLISARILAIILLCTPLWIIVLVALFYFIPGLSKLVSNIFLELLGDWNIFAISSALLESITSSNQVKMENIFIGFLSLLLEAALDAIFMGCCIFLFQSAAVGFHKGKRNGKNYYYHIFSRPKWVMSVAGVCLAVVLEALFDLSSHNLGDILKGSVSFILLIVGIITIFKAGNRIKGKYKENRFRENREGFLLKLVLSILISAFKAIAVVNLITLVMEGPSMLHAGSHWLPMTAWLLCSVLLMFLCDLLDGQNQ